MAAPPNQRVLPAHPCLETRPTNLHEKNALDSLDGNPALAAALYRNV